LEDILDLKIFVNAPRAAENAVVGHIWPAGRFLPVRDLFDCAY